MWDLIVSVPDHCLSFYFPIKLLPKPTIKANSMTKIKVWKSNRMVYKNKNLMKLFCYLLRWQVVEIGQCYTVAVSFIFCNI